MILDPGFDLTLRPMKYPIFFEMYKNGIKNTWTVDEIDFNSDLTDLHSKMSKNEIFLINRLISFFATGDSIVGNNLVLNLYKHINAPEARLYLSRQLYEEALHVQFYLTLLDSYIPDMKKREEAFSAIHNIESIKNKADFSFKWIDSIQDLDKLDSIEKRKRFLMNLLCFAACIEGLFFFAAFAYVYYLRSKNLLNGLASGTNWVFRDESAHIDFSFKVFETAVAEQPELFDSGMKDMVLVMIDEAIRCEMKFACEFLDLGLAGLSKKDMKSYLEFIADQRLERLGIPPQYNKRNPFPFMELQDTQELANFFERRVSAYQVGITGNVTFDETF